MLDKKVYNKLYQAGFDSVSDCDSDRKEEVIAVQLELLNDLLASVDSLDEVLLYAGSSEDERINYYIFQLLHERSRERHLEKLRERVTPLNEWKEVLGSAIKLYQQLQIQKTLYLDLGIELVSEINEAEKADVAIRSLSKTSLAPTLESIDLLEKKIFFSKERAESNPIYFFARDLEQFSLGFRGWPFYLNGIIEELTEGNSEQVEFAKKVNSVCDNISLIYAKVCSFKYGAVLGPQISEFSQKFIEDHKAQQNFLI